MWTAARHAPAHEYATRHRSRISYNRLILNYRHLTGEKATLTKSCFFILRQTFANSDPLSREWEKKNGSCLKGRKGPIMKEGPINKEGDLARRTLAENFESGFTIRFDRQIRSGYKCRAPVAPGQNLEGVLPTDGKRVE